MKTEFFESDPFAPKKTEMLLNIDTDYRFDKGDEVVLVVGGRPLKIRVMSVLINVSTGTLTREILALKV